MKRKHLLRKVKQGSLNVFTFSLFVALFFMAANTFGQVQGDKVITVPTDPEDPTTLMDFGIHLTDSSSSTGGQPIVLDKNGTNQIDECKTGAWAEYQIVATKTAKYLCTTAATTKQNNTAVNIGAYKTETETWPETGLGDTVLIVNNGSWTATDQLYDFVLELEGGVVYTVRINFLRTDGTHNWTVNLFNGLSFREVTGSTDASLSDIKLNGESLAGFKSNVLNYDVALPPAQWVSGLEATANDENAVVELPEIGDPAGAKTTVEIKVTSEAGTVSTYKLNLIMPTVIEDGVQLAMTDYYYSKGVAAAAAKVNSINNNDYIDYYVYTEYDENVEFTLNCANGYDDGITSYLNVSTLALNNGDWKLKDIYSKRIEVTRDETGTSSWNTAYAKDYTFSFATKAEEPTLIRIYGITNKSNTADIFSMTFKLIFESIDATLSDLQVNGVTVEGFDPEVTSYIAALPIGATSATTAATANDGGAQGVTGTGSVDIVAGKGADTITVTAESGFTIDYIVNLIAPVELAFVDDTLELAMGDNLFFNGGPRISNVVFNYFADSTYADYYIYSATDKDVHVVLNVACGIVDTAYAKINVSTFAVGSEWMLDDSKTWNIPSQGVGLWGVEYASDVKYNLSLKAGEPVMMRIFGMTNGGGAGDIHHLYIVDGTTDYTKLDDVQAGNVSVYGESSSIHVLCDEAYVGGSVQIYDLSGRLVKDELIGSDRNVYNVERDGLYLVKLVSTSKNVQTVKCIVR